MSARAERLIKDFPEIPAENIIMGTRKDVISLDIMLDDGAHNILNSRAAYPVLFRKPWNEGLSGLLSVNSYDDFLHFCELFLICDRHFDTCIQVFPLSPLVSSLFLTKEKPLFACLSVCPYQQLFYPYISSRGLFVAFCPF